MYLSDAEIRRRTALPLTDRGLRVTPWDDSLVGPVSYDVRLGTGVLLYSDPGRRVGDQEPLVIDLSESPYELQPGDFALAATMETVTVGNGLVALVAGKSSRAREGLSIHTAGLADPGFSGEVTLELTTARPFLLTPGMKIGQITFVDAYLSDDTYEVRGHYQDQTGPTPSWEVA